jgi:hypothetical protein
MKRDLVMKNFQSSFLSCEYDTETILKKLFIESKPYCDELKRLLVINTKDCLDNLNNEVYNNKIKEMTIGKLIKQGYIKIVPKIKFPENEEIKSYIIISYDNFTPNEKNPQFRDCIVHFDILCHTDYWDIGDYRLRPLKIAGYIDGILNNTKLSGIGTFQFVGCNELILNEELSGYSLMYAAIHGSEDKIIGLND